MEILLDTHIALWALDEDEKLSKKAMELINDKNNDLFFSAMSVLEVAIKHKKSPLIFPRSGQSFYDDCLKSDIYTLPLKPKHAIFLDTIKLKDGYNHNDPFDRALIAQAKQEKMILLTHDKMMECYDEDCIMIV